MNNCAVHRRTAGMARAVVRAPTEALQPTPARAANGPDQGVPISCQIRPGRTVNLGCQFTHLIGPP